MGLIAKITAEYLSSTNMSNFYRLLPGSYLHWKTRPTILRLTDDSEAMAWLWGQDKLTPKMAKVSHRDGS